GLHGAPARPRLWRRHDPGTVAEPSATPRRSRLPTARFSQSECLRPDERPRHGPKRRPAKCLNPDAPASANLHICLLKKAKAGCAVAKHISCAGFFSFSAVPLPIVFGTTQEERKRGKAHVRESVRAGTGVRGPARFSSRKMTVCLSPALGVSAKVHLARRLLYYLTSGLQLLG